MLQNPKLSVEERVEDLIGRMTLEEKLRTIVRKRSGDFQANGDYSLDGLRKTFGEHGMGHLSCPTTDMDAKKAVIIGNQIQKISIEETRLGIPTIIDAKALHGCRANGVTSYP